MPVLNFLLKQWEGQCLDFMSKLQTIRRRPAKKAVHDIRVAVKKLKSNLCLVNSFAEAGGVKKFTGIQQFFRISGKFRDVDMSLLLLRKTGMAEQIQLPSFSRHLWGMLAITRRATWTGACENHETELAKMTEWVKKQLITVSEEAAIKKTEALSAEILYEVQLLSTGFNRHAHPVRIKLKRLFYWLSQCPVNPFFDKTKMKKLDRALKALGNWHDYFVLNNKLRRFRKEYLVKNTGEYQNARKMEKITAFMQEQWLAGAHQNINSIVKMD
jgi:CHAD domain-containing protein